MNRKGIFRALAWALALLLTLGGGALADLAKGDRGDAVADAQRRLIAAGYLNDTADGIFGKKTEAAVSAFQQAMGLPATGILDDETLARLGAAGNESTPADTPSDIVVDEPIDAPARSADGDVFAGLKLMEGCGWVDDEESESYGLGRNAAGNEVVYGISLVNDGAPEEMELTALSWLEELPVSSSDMMSSWEAAKEGVTGAKVSRMTEIDSSGNVYPVASVDIFLPDDPSIAGEQTVTVSLAGHTAVARILMTYDGGYGDGNGWKLRNLGVTVDGAAR